MILGVIIIPIQYFACIWVLNFYLLSNPVLLKSVIVILGGGGDMNTEYMNSEFTCVHFDGFVQG